MSSPLNGEQAFSHPVAVALEDLPLFLKIERSKKQRPIVARVTMISTSLIVLVDVEEASFPAPARASDLPAHAGGGRR